FDIDGNEFIDLSGAYGVNVFGTDFYKTCIDAGRDRAAALGPILGPYHPSVVANVRRLRRISGLDEVSFHMSGTEAVMQAVRLARYHTRRSHIVRFCGAYHGWWDDVQPGVGNPSAPGKVYTLADISDATLQVLATRSDIACVLVNPLQALHPNGNAPSDGALITGMRQAGCDIEAYRAWLKRLREVCTRAGIVLILDEIFVGFRIAPGGAQEYFGIEADLVTYGKTLGGGLPVGVLCGRAALMKRYREDRPLDICFARGTFNAHPYVMTTMDAFLERFESDDFQRHYRNLDGRWNDRANQMNQALETAGLPIRVAHFSSIFVVLFTRPGRYNWMLQYYLNEAGILLPWVGIGRLIFSINFPEDEFDEVTRRVIAAGEKMKHDGWWSGPELSAAAIGRMVFKEMLAARFGQLSR
ncbi:MAG: aminotransferase class III-fold pyridoxal phosphate-dependent enzyme, partial [Wenzhouxiangellaceae bacterium]